MFLGFFYCIFFYEVKANFNWFEIEHCAEENMEEIIMKKWGGGGEQTDG